MVSRHYKYDLQKTMHIAVMEAEIMRVLEGGAYHG